MVCYVFMRRRPVSKSRFPTGFLPLTVRFCTVCRVFLLTYGALAQEPEWHSWPVTLGGRWRSIWPGAFCGTTPEQWPVCLHSLVRMRNGKLQENTSTYISTIAMIIASTAVLVSIHTWRRAKRYKIIFKKLKNGEELNDKEILLLQKLRKPAQK